VSVDAWPTQKKFAEETGAQFTLLSDFDKEVAHLYGVLDEKVGVAWRVTFVIDKEGMICRIDTGEDALDITGVKECVKRCELKTDPLKTDH
jgi:peroxiredoxin